MARYAEGTNVSPERSLEEIRRTLNRYGATGFLYYEKGLTVVVCFEMQGYGIRVDVELPDPDDRQITHNRQGYRKAARDAQAAYDREVRRKWRVLVLLIKSRLELVESGIEDFERAWLPYLTLPSGQAFGDWAVPQVRAAWQGRGMPELLPGASMALPEPRRDS